MDIKERFWMKATKGAPDECWDWHCSTKGKGYGQFWYNGKPQRAHRIAWEIEKGNVPKRLNVLHRCDNRKCVNPAHLYLGTNSDNMLDMYRKRRRQTPAFKSRPPFPAVPGVVR